MTDTPVVVYGVSGSTGWLAHCVIHGNCNHRQTPLPRAAVTR
jgi:hypothetical protein